MLFSPKVTAEPIACPDCGIDMATYYGSDHWCPICDETARELIEEGLA